MSYVVLAVFSGVLVTTVCIFECCISEKCDCCPQKLLKLCRKQGPETQNEAVNEPANMPLMDFNDPAAIDSPSSDNAD